VNAEDLISLFGEIDERYIKEAEPRKSGEIVITTATHKPSVIILKAAQIAACVVLLAFVSFVIFFSSQRKIEYGNAPEDGGTALPIFTENIPGETNVTTVPEPTVTTAVSTKTPTQSNDNIININALNYAPWMSSTFGPLDENLVPMAFEEIELYYGVAITPDYLPPDIVYEDFFTEQNSGGKRGIYKDAAGEIIYDKYSLVYLSLSAIDYYNENGRFETITPKGVYINSGKFSGIGTGIRWDNEGIKTSQIGGYEMRLASYKTDVTHYVAVFDKDDVHFVIETVDIPESEFIKIVTSYTTVDNRMSKIKIHKILGEPDGLLSGFDGEIFVTETGKRIVIYYDASQYVTAVKIMDEDDTLIWEEDKSEHSVLSSAP
jgi:hypothetical protein